MRRLALLLLFWTASLAAQTVSLSAWPNGSQALNQGWRTHAGDNPAWAQPAFDDTAWPSISFGAQDNDDAGWRWYRLRVHFPAGHPPLALLVTAGDGSYEVYANDQRLPGPALKSSLRITLPKEESIALPDFSGDVVIAIRTYIPPTSMFVADRGAWRVRIGTVPAIEEAARAALGERMNATWPGVAIDALLGLSAIPILFLFWRQRNHREYLWLGLYLISTSTGDAAFELTLNSFVPFSINWFWGDPTGYLSLVALIEFTFSFVGKRVTRVWRLYEFLLVTLTLCLNLPAWFGLISRGFINLVESGLMLPGSIALFVLLLIWYRRGLRETAWLILPIFLAVFSLAVIDLGIAASYMGWSRLIWLGNPQTIWGFPMLSLDPVNFLFLLAIGVVMFFRFTRVSLEQARAASEFEAARAVQQVIVPEAIPVLPGFHLDAVYKPAGEVGGDFYQIVPTPSGGVLAVIGDVSGKGMPAAMTVSLLVGTFRTLAHYTQGPGEILRAMNQRMCGRNSGGFTTCLVLRIDPGGAISAASAGHLAPYIDGHEVPLGSGLPLGLSQASTYSESTLSLAPAAQLTVLTDGVVEAQSATGELFGFDRTAAISTQSAESIAAAAQQFGQEDDITVLTLTFAPAEVLHG
jgi:hypothetical protein